MGEGATWSNSLHKAFFIVTINKAENPIVENKGHLL